MHAFMYFFDGKTTNLCLQIKVYKKQAFMTKIFLFYILIIKKKTTEQKRFTLMKFNVFCLLFLQASNPLAYSMIYTREPVLANHA